MIRSLHSKFVVTTFALCISNLVSANELDFFAGATASYIDQTTESKDQDITINANNTLVTPFVALVYDGRDLQLNARVTNNHVYRKLENESVSQDFTEYNYSGTYRIIDNVLSVSFNGLENFRSNALDSFLVDDFLLNADSLNKVKSNNASLNLNLRRNEIIGLSAITSYNKTSSTIDLASLQDPSIFQNETYGLSFNMISGTNLTGVRITLAGNARYSKRDSGQDFVSQTVNLNIDTAIFDSLALAVNGFYENNEIKTDFELPFDSLREFHSYGAGLIWQSAIDRMIEVTLNRSSTNSQLEDGEDETDTFIGYSVNWAFSTRTRLQGSYTRRFFGDAGNLSFRHQLRNWRSSINYSEVVSSTSQLINSQNTGLFVCDSGSNDFSSCRLSDDLEPDLNAGEVVVPLTIPTLDLNDRIIIRKSLTAQTAVSRRRTTLSITGSVSEDEEVEINRIFDVQSLSMLLNFQVSQRSSISVSNLYSEREQDRSGELQQATTRRQELRYNRRISNNFTTALALTYLKRDGEVNRGFEDFRGINGSLTDRRISFSLSYTFGENRSR